MSIIPCVPGLSTKSSNPCPPDRTATRNPSLTARSTATRTSSALVGTKIFSGRALNRRLYPRPTNRPYSASPTPTTPGSPARATETPSAPTAVPTADAARNRRRETDTNLSLQATSTRSPGTVASSPPPRRTDTAPASRPESAAVQQSTTGHRVLTLLCTLAGTILIALAAASAGNRALFLAESSTAQGTVVGFAGNASRSGKSLLVEFTTTSGKRIRIEGGVSVTSRGPPHTRRRRHCPLRPPAPQPRPTRRRLPQPLLPTTLLRRSRHGTTAHRLALHNSSTHTQARSACAIVSCRA